jgi:hypothetical protein
LETVRIWGRSSTREGSLCGELDWAAVVGEVWIPPLEVSGQVVVQYLGTNL